MHLFITDSRNDLEKLIVFRSPDARRYPISFSILGRLSLPLTCSQRVGLFGQLMQGSRLPVCFCLYPWQATSFAPFSPSSLLPSLMVPFSFFPTCDPPILRDVFILPPIVSLPTCLTSWLQEESKFHFLFRRLKLVVKRRGLK